MATSVASRFPPTFSITQGLLSSLPMTEEEEQRLLEEQLYGTELVYPEDEEDDIWDDYDVAEEPAPDDYPTEVNDEEEPIVVYEDEDAAPVATDLSRQPTPVGPGGVDPLAPLPEEEKQEEKAPVVIEAETAEEAAASLESVMQAAGERAPVRAYEPLLEQARQAKANLEAQNSGRPIEKTKVQAAYDDMVAAGMAKMAADPNVTAKDLQQWAVDLGEEVFGGQVAREWTLRKMADYLSYAQGRIAAGEQPLPPGVVIEGAEAAANPEQSVQRTLEEGFGKGTLQTIGSAAAGIQAIQEATGLSEPEATDRWRQWSEAVAGQFPEGTRLENIDSFADAVRWAGGVAMDNTANLATSVAGGIVGGVVRGSVGAAMGAFGPSFVLEAGQIEQGNKALNPDQKAGLATMAAAGGAALLDSILPGYVGKQLTSRFGKEAADDIAMKALMMPGNAGRIARLKEIAKGGLKGTGLEAVTEAGQTGLELIGTAVETGTDIPEDALWQMIEAGAAGAVLGGPAGAVGAAVETENKINGAKLRPRLTNPEGVEEEFQLPDAPISSPFGTRRPFKTANGKMASSDHKGDDYALPAGTPVGAGASGEIIFAGKKGGYGNQVVVRHSDGTTSSYSHLSKIVGEVGDQVGQGDIIGNVGSTGNATGPHLHLERRDADGVPIRPKDARRIVTIENEKGETVVNPDADPAEIDEFYAAMQAQQEAGFPVEDLPEPPAPSRDVATAPEPSPRKSAQAAAQEVLGGAQAQQIALARGAELEASKATSPARVALANLQTPARSDDLTQPQVGEEPVFADNVEGSEVVGFTNPETGSFRAIGEPVTLPEAQPEVAPLPPAVPTPETTIPEAAPVEEVPVEPQPMAATTEQLELERKQRLLDAMTALPATMAKEAADARTSGRAVGLGLADAPPLSGMTKTERTAFNVGLREGQKALATEGTSVPVSNASGEALATATEIVNEPAPQPTAPLRPTTQTVRAPKIDKLLRNRVEARVDKIEERLFDLENEGTKGQVKILMQQLVRQGVLEQADIDSMSYMFKDRDMGVEDVASEVRQMVQDWQEQQLAGTGRPWNATPAKKAKPKPKPKPKPTKKQVAKEDTSARTERSRPETNDQRGQENRQVAAERVAPALNDDGTYSLDHFGPEGLTQTDPQMWGKSKSLSPEERAYIEKAPARTHFGIHTGEPGGYIGEFGEGTPRYEARIPAERMYDVIADPDGLWVRGKPWVGERNIKEAGYAGYWYKNQELGLVAEVFEPVPVKRVTKAKQQAPSNLKVAEGLPPQISQKAMNEVAAEMRQMNIDGHPDLTLEIIERFAGADSRVQGEFNPLRMQIKIAAMASRFPRLTARHEVIHWAREARIFNREEWAILAKWAQSHPGLMNWAKATYPNLSLEEQIEEAVAEGFARWDGKSDLMKISAADSKVEVLFERFLRVLAAIRNAFNRSGISRGQIKAAQEIFERMNRGEQVKLAAERRRPTTVTFGKRRTPWTESIAREMLAGNISPEQREFLAENQGVKFQSAWHGSPKSDIEQFKLDFIGTGEGAQAFGWGLYFAQRQEVAEWYRKKLVLGGKRDPVDVAVQIGGQPLRDFFAGWDHGAVYEVADRIMNFFGQGKKPYNGWLESIHVEFDRDIDDWVGLAEKDMEEGGDVAAEMEQEIEGLRASQKAVGQVFDALKRNDMGAYTTIKMKEVEGGKLYKVEVPDNEELIDLEKPLRDQPPPVLEALKKVRQDLIEANADILGQRVTEIGDEFWELDALAFTRSVLPNITYFGFKPKNPSPELDAAIDMGAGAMATSIWLRDHGVKGASYLDRDSRQPGETATRNFVIFDDSAITLKAKQRVINSNISSPLSDPANPNPGIFRRIHDQTMGLLGALAGADVDASDNLVDAFKRKVTQRYQQVIKTQQRVAKLLGVDRLPPGQNPMEMITADERGYKLQYLTDNLMKPMFRQMTQLGVSMDDLGLFLYARHAPARNARIAKINPEFRAPANPGSGMTDAEAMQIMADFHAAGKMGDLMSVATHIDGMIAMAQRERLDGGLLSPEDVAAGFQPGDYYVPLRGNENVEPELEMDFALAARKGGGFSTSGRESHRMFGRASKADLEEIIGYTITQAQDAIDRSYRNKVGQSMLEMFRAVPDPDFVKIDRVKRVAVWNKAKGQVEYQMQTRITDPKEQQRTMYVKENGDVTKLTFNDHNPSAMRFVKAAKNLGVEPLSWLFRVGSMFTRFWSKSNTQWNPDFILANAVKDVQTGLLNAKTLDQKGLRRRMIKNLASLGPLRGAFFGSMHGAGAGFASGSRWHRVYAEFEANGGKLNYGQIEPLEDAIRTAHREMRNAKRSNLHPIKAAQQVGLFIDHLNSAFENMTRLAAYQSLREMGVEPKRAAEAVRELTTNFQQHGEWGPKVNAVYGFANASMIGGARMMRTISKAPQLAAGLMMLGILSDMLNSLADEEDWDAYTEEEKHSQFIILLPDEFGFDLRPPAGYGLNAFITAGRKMSELWRGKKNKDGTKMSMAEAMSDVMMGFVNSFSPITGSSWQNIVAPTFFDPLVNIYRNENNWGRPLRPMQPMRKEQQKPESELAFDNTHQFWKAMATAMNDWTGGNAVVPGLVDISPTSLQHATEETVGGAGRTFMRTLKLIEKAATGEDVGLNDIPIVRRFAGNPYGAATAKGEQVSLFYERLSEGRVVVAQAKEMMARFGKDSPEYQEFRKDHEPIIEFHETITAAEKRLKAYNTADNAAERGLIRANGLNRRDRKAIFMATKVMVPAGRPLREDEVDKIKEKLKAKKERLALLFNDKYTSDVMKAE